MGAEQLDRDQRGAKHRARVMLAATVQASGLWADVRVRNISETGALLEGETLPELGSRLRLQRGECQAEGEVIWARAGRCGIRFDEPIVVSQWAGVQIPSAGQVHAAGALRGEPPLPVSLLARPAPGPECEAQLPRRIAEELAYVQRLIGNIAREMAANPQVIHRHARAFQDFDLASRMLGHLARVLAADDRVRAAERVGMEELRNRLLRS